MQSQAVDKICIYIPTQYPSIVLYDSNTTGHRYGSTRGNQAVETTARFRSKQTYQETEIEFKTEVQVDNGG